MDRSLFFDRLYPFQDEVYAPDPDAFLADLRRLGEELALLPPPGR